MSTCQSPMEGDDPMGRQRHQHQQGHWHPQGSSGSSARSREPWGRRDVVLEAQPDGTFVPVSEPLPPDQAFHADAIASEFHEARSPVAERQSAAADALERLERLQRRAARAQEEALKALASAQRRNDEVVRQLTAATQQAPATVLCSTGCGRAARIEVTLFGIPMGVCGLCAGRGAANAIVHLLAR